MYKATVAEYKQRIADLMQDQNDSQNKAEKE